MERQLSTVRAGKLESNEDLLLSRHPESDPLQVRYMGHLSKRKSKSKLEDMRGKERLTSTGKNLSTGLFQNLPVASLLSILLFSLGGGGKVELDIRMNLSWFSPFGSLTEHACCTGDI